jgi:hypothetical protein
LIKKNGFPNGRQQYRCHSCGKYFSVNNPISNSVLWSEYTVGKQTYSQLSVKYNRSLRTIQRRLEQHTLLLSVLVPGSVIVLMDTTYFGRGFGVMLFRDAITKANLLKYYVKYESNALYYQGITELQSKGFNILAIVCDGRKGLIQMFPDIPVQMCQFHQAAIIRRYLTTRPKLQASKELIDVVKLMKQTDKETFVGALELWHSKWKEFLNERTIEPSTKKCFYTHKKLRSAYRSLKNNLQWLFTWYDNIELNIPNTTNAIDGLFSDLKNKLRNHNGLSSKRKIKFIDDYLKM